jgi:hypothetical protein
MTFILLVNEFTKYKLVDLKKKVVFFKLEGILPLKNLPSSSFVLKKKRPNIATLKKEENEPFNYFSYKYPLGFAAGCNRFSFRITFKEYKAGLKPAKFSLLLNQFNLNLETFFFLINEVLINNLPLTFFENFFFDYLNDIDFKIHFLVVLRTRSKTVTTTKFLIIPKGLFFSHLKEILWPTLYIDSLFFFSILTYFKKFFFKVGLIFILILYYLYKLIHNKLSLIVNKSKIYNYEERAFESLGNIIAFKNNSFKIYCNLNFKLPRYSYLFSHRCIVFFFKDTFEENLIFAELTYLKDNKYFLNIYFDVLTLDEHLKPIIYLVEND